MPAWIAIIGTVVTSLPQIISIVSSLVSLIHSIRDPKKKAQAITILTDAYKSGDPAQIKDAHSLCQGIACEAELKKD